MRSPEGEPAQEKGEAAQGWGEVAEEEVARWGGASDNTE